EQEQRRPVAAAADPGDEVGALGHPRVELALDAVRLEVGAQELRRGGLVARRIRRVDPDEPAEELRHLAAQACRRHVRSILAPMSDLFSDAAAQRAGAVAPLALRLRPRTLDEFVGQRHMLGEGSALRRAIEEDRVRSSIFYGPPGSGKT